MNDHLESARRDREADLARVAELTADEQDYLAHADELEDPDTDGIGCECGSA